MWPGSFVLPFICVVTALLGQEATSLRGIYSDNGSRRTKANDNINSDSFIPEGQNHQNTEVSAKRGRESISGFTPSTALSFGASPESTATTTTTTTTSSTEPDVLPVVIDIQYDSQPHETFWVIKNSTNQAILAFQTSHPVSPYDKRSEEIHLSAMGEYVLEVTDTARNGIVDGSVTVSTKINQTQYVVAFLSGNDFKSLAQLTFAMSVDPDPLTAIQEEEEVEEDPFWLSSSSFSAADNAVTLARSSFTAACFLLGLMGMSFTIA